MKNRMQIFPNTVICNRLIVGLLVLGFASTLWAYPMTTRMGKPPKNGKAPVEDGTVPKDIKQSDRKDTTANAQNLLEQAKETQDPVKKQQLKLQAARLLINGKLLQQAKLILSEIVQTQLAGDDLINYRLLVARIAVAEQKPQQAIKLAPVLSPGANLELRIESHRIRASAYRQLGNRLQAIHELLSIAPLVPDDAQKRNLYNVVWSTLKQFSVAGLEQLVTQSQSPNTRAWFQLALLYKQNRLNPNQFRQKLLEWKSANPGHPAESSVLESIATEQQAIASRPTKLALLLPLTGRVRVQAQAIRDGFIAAHFASSNDRKNIHVKIYDTSSTDMNSLYQRAVSEGAEMIIGPLRKEKVRELIKIPDLRVPVLTLNFLGALGSKEASDKKVNVTYFGLAPEDEARQIAERAIFENKTRALVFVPNNTWGGRIMRAFSDRFKELGGEVREVGKYNPRSPDHRKSLMALLNLDESYARYKSVAIQIQYKVKFEPRRRHDIDFIFVGAFAAQARLIVPQLKFYRASEVPIYSTSHVYTGVQDQRRDADMNGIIFCDTPWTLSLYSNPNPIQLSIKQNYEHRLRGLSSLYAMGVDAYNLVPYLKWLKQQDNQSYEGQTGLLSIDENNRIRRVLKWAQFKKGIATVIQQQVIPEKRQSSVNLDSISETILSHANP